VHGGKQIAQLTIRHFSRMPKVPLMIKTSHPLRAIHGDAAENLKYRGQLHKGRLSTE